ncbi:MAG: neutral/alkaline non-lysosomal ceramidase N-terminal domain-containing protein [Thermoprotei archaeon]|nr:neutral/alkaline non-lysosomal ceramidase N-terminal domain-containing protein [Thermoprotei archaeon]
MNQLKAGVAKAVITPPIGTRLSGYAHRVQPSVGILDDLYVRTLVLDSGEKTIAIIVCDLLWLSRSFVKDVKKSIEERMGLHEREVMISCIHTHYGPDLTQVSDAYLEVLKKQIAGTVYSAISNMKDAYIGFAKSHCLAGANRRNPKSPYGPYFLYSWPEGPLDPEVTVMFVKDHEGRNMCTLVNYACHPVTLGPDELRISKDYPNYVIGLLEDVLKGPAIFINGCCGNINPRWIWDRPDEKIPPKRTFPRELKPRLEETRRIGLMIGASALKAITTITKFTSDVRIRSALDTIKLPVRDDIPEMIKTWMKPHPLRDHINEIRGGAKNIATEVQAFRIGDVALIGLPGEIFVEYQLQLKRYASEIGVNMLFISELANDTIYYVPTPRAYEEGGYEPTMAIVAPEAGDILMSKARDMLKELMK